MYNLFNKYYKYKFFSNENKKIGGVIIEIVIIKQLYDILLKTTTASMNKIFGNYTTQLFGIDIESTNVKEVISQNIATGISNIFNIIKNKFTYTKPKVYSEQVSQKLNLVNESKNKIKEDYDIIKKFLNLFKYDYLFKCYELLNENGKKGFQDFIINKKKNIFNDDITLLHTYINEIINQNINKYIDESNYTHFNDYIKIYNDINDSLQILNKTNYDTLFNTIIDICKSEISDENIP